MTRKLIVLYLLCIFKLVHNPIVAQSFSGTYHIGSSVGADYPSISAAIDDLKSGTVTGNVIFQLEAGTYHETVDLSSLNNGTFTFTFQGVSNASTIIHPNGKIATDNSGFSLANSSNILLKDFKLEMDDISSTKVFFDENETKGISIYGASNIDIEDLVLSNSKHVFSQSQRVYIASAVSLEDVENIAIANCNFSGAGFLVHLDDFQNVSITNSDFSEGLTHISHFRTVENDAAGLSIDGNTFTGPFPSGLSAAAISLFGRSGTANSYSSNLAIKNNVIDTKVAASDDGIRGIYAQGQENAEISNNKIHDGSFGIRFENCRSSLLNANEIYNASNRALYLQLGGEINVVNNVFTSQKTAVFVINPANLRLANNTLYASGTEPALNFFGESGDSLVVVNNIFSVENTVGSEVVLTNITADEITIDHNLYSGNANTYTIVAYRLGADIGQNNGLEYYASSLGDWNANQALYDQNSQSFQPVFAGKDDYHVVNDNYRFGTFLDDITTDIDGDPRVQATGVDVGADQTTVVVAAPTIASISPMSGPVGTSLTISGTGFDTNPSNNKVFIDGIQATVTTASPSQLDVTVPLGVSAGRVTVSTSALIAEAQENFNLTFESNRTLTDKSFTSDLTIGTGAESILSLTADIDQDGRNDIVIANATDETISIYRNISSGAGNLNMDVKQDLVLAGRPGEMALEDFNGDGLLDLVVSYTDKTVISIFRNFSTADITFDSRQDFNVATNNTFGIAAGDLDFDGKIDLVFVDSQSDEVVVLKNGSTLGSISFSTMASYATGDNPVSVAIADMDRDQIPDVIVANQTAMSLSVLVNDGAMNLAAKSDFATGGEPTQIISADIDGDQIKDLISISNITLSSPNGKSTVLVNTSNPGSLSFSATNLSLIGHRGTISDFNGDGKLDIASVHIFNGLSFIKNTSTAGNLSFESEQLVSTDTNPVGVISGDLDHDGEPDILITGVSAGLNDQAEILRNLSASTDISSFSLSEEASSAIIDSDNHTITLGLVDCSDIKRLKPAFSASFGSNAYLVTASLDSILQISSVTENDYSNPFIYTVVAEDGLTAQNWVASVTGARYSDLLETDVSTCDSYEWYGTVYSQSGTYQEVFTNAVGCDSTEVLHLTILESTNSIDYVNACESYEWNGTNYTLSGTYQEIFTNAVGCDSTATLNLTILEPTSGDDDIEACVSYEWEGMVYTASGTYQEILTNAVGCDSTATLNLTILEPTSGDDDVEACESYEWEGTVYTTSGTYQEILTNSVGCDSTATLNLTILEPTSGDDNVEACESYEWEGTVYTASGTYQEILTNSAGCDSTATLNLTILEPTSGDDNVESCESYEWEGTVYTASGTYQEILTNAVGCDSTATLNLTILEPTSGSATIDACESYEWEGNVYTSSGTYQEILTNSVGCDSTATLKLSILEPSSGVAKVTVCDSYEWEGTVYTTSGVYQEILTNAVGCDSTVTLNLTVLGSTTGEKEVSVCESYKWQGTIYTASGTYQEVLTNSVGCDSTATLKLTILEPTTGVEEVEACGSYEWEGTIYTTSGTYQEILTNAAGCDSTATLNLSILESTFSFEEVEACDSYEWNDQVLTENGIHEIMLTNVAGCDSLAIIDLTLLESTFGEETVVACGSYEWEGERFESSGIYEMILAGSNGCDSVATLNLTIGQEELQEVIMDVCSGYTFGSQQITSSGLYQETFSNSLGCDSTVLLTAEVFDAPVNGIIRSEATLMAEDNSEGMVYQWYDCSTDQKLEGETNKEFIPDSDGDYSLEISNGVCSVQTTCFSYSREDNVLSSDREGSVVSVFPNPTSEKVQVTFAKGDKSDIVIFGLDGRIIVEADVSGQTRFEYMLPEPGLYLLQINSSSGQQDFIKVLRK